jgi:hypothetical protein
MPARRFLPLTISLLLASESPAAHAQDKAAADAAFAEARALVEAGKYAEACPKFELSNQLDPAIGTLLNLADCHEQIGRTASAWAEFHEVAEKARYAGQTGRAAEAERRANALAPRLVRLQVVVKAPASDLAILRDGSDITKLAGVAVPVDPGEHEIRASRPGYKPWRESVTTGAEGSTTVTEVPPLELAPVEPLVTTTATTNRTAGSAPKRRGPGLRVLAIGAGGAGVAMIGTALIFGALANSKYDDSRAFCSSGNVCSPEGIALVDAAR